MKHKSPLVYAAKFPTDKDLRVNDGSLSTEQIWKLLSEKLSGFLLQRVSDPQVAEDLLQETFLRIHQKLGDIDDIQRITAWVFQIARNLVIDHYRSLARLSAAKADELQVHADEEENLNELVSGWLTEMVAELPDGYRQAVELYELEGVSQQQIADRLGISLSGAKSRVQRGREQLKTLLFACCSFEQDRRGNIINYANNSTQDGKDCADRCD